MSKNLTKPSLDPVTVVTQRELTSPQFTAKKTPVCDDDERSFTSAFSAAVASLQVPGKEVAARLGISEPQLSEMKNGTRAVTGPRIAGWMQTNKQFGVALLREFVKLTKNVSVVERKPINKKKLDSQLVLSLKRNPAILRAVLADASTALGIHTDEADEILNSEETDEKESA